MMRNFVFNAIELIKHFLVFILVFFVSLLLLSIFTSTIGNAWVEDYSYIKIKSPVLISSKYIVLEDIAEIHISDKNLEFFAKKLKLGVAALAGSARNLQGNYVKNLIAAKVSKDIKVILPDNIRIITRAKFLDKKLIKEKLLKKLMTESIWSARLATGGKVIISNELFQQEIKVPDRDILVDFKFPAEDDLLGTTNVELKVLDGQQLLKRIWLRANIMYRGPIVVANENFRPGDIINSMQLATKVLDVSNAPSAFFVKKEVLDGFRARTFIRKGFALTEAIVDHPESIAFGDLIKIELISDNVSIVAEGKALSRGKIGDSIRVQNISSKKIIQAKIVAPKTVRVVY